MVLIVGNGYGKGIRPVKIISGVVPGTADRWIATEPFAGSEETKK